MIETSRKYFSHLIYLFVCISAVFYIPFSGQEGIDPIVHAYNMSEFFFKFGVISLFAISQFLRPARTGDYRLLSAFLLCLVFSSLLNGMNLGARRALTNVGLGILFYKTIVEYIDFKTVKHFGWWVLGLIGINFLMMTFQYFNIDPLYTHIDKVRLNLPEIAYDERMVGFMRLKVNVGVFGAIAGACLSFINPLLSIFALPFLWLGNASSAIVAFIISMSLILYFKLKKIVWVLVIASIIGLGSAYIIKHDMPLGQFQERFKLWHASTGVVLKTNPILGLGAGSFSRMGFQTKQGDGFENINWAWLHNEPLQVFFEGGLVCFSILILFLIRQTKDFLTFKHIKEIPVLYAFLLTIFLVSLLQFPFHVGKFASLSILALALFHTGVRECQSLSL